MNGRPRLKSHVRPLRRGPGSLQLGLHPDAGVVLDGLTDAEIAVVEALDGSLDISALYAAAAVAGVAAGRLSDLIATLDRQRLLVDTTDHDHVAARSGQHVVISADGDLPWALADLLRAGGVGRVTVGTNAVDALDLELRGHRSDGAPDRAGRQPAAFGSVSGLPDLVVLAAMGAIRPDAGEPWLRRGIPHLPLVVQGHRVQVGPLIMGGDGPCLSCLDLHRRDRDAAWPALMFQLASSGPLMAGSPVTLESTLSAMTIGAAAMIVHSCLDGQPVSGNLSLEISLPWPTIQHRRWFSHPMCACLVGQATMTG